MHDLSIAFERFMNDRRVRIGGAIVGGLIIVVSLVVGNLAQTPVHTTKPVAVLPEYPLNIPMFRQLPAPQPKKGDVVSARTTGRETTKRRTLTARR